MNQESDFDRIIIDCIERGDAITHMQVLKTKIESERFANQIQIEKLKHQIEIERLQHQLYMEAHRRNIEDKDARIKELEREKLERERP